MFNEGRNRLSEEKQQTLARPFAFSGTGLHTGAACSAKVSPLQPGQGIRFLLEKISASRRASLDSVESTERCTTLAWDNGSVSTVEHLLSALTGCGIDNCLIEMTGPEVAAMDGSALPFVQLIREVGVVEQDAGRTPIRLDRPVWVSDGTSHLIALPADELQITAGIDFSHAVLGKQVWSGRVTPQIFEEEIAPARTFGFMREVEELRKRGLALGGGLHNAVVIGEVEYLTKLRFVDEPVRHKALDLIGDLALLGAPLHAHIIALKGSHRLHVELAREILKGRRN